VTSANQGGLRPSSNLPCFQKGGEGRNLWVYEVKQGKRRSHGGTVICIRWGDNNHSLEGKKRRLEPRAGDEREGEDTQGRLGVGGLQTLHKKFG